jgi:hypothetical protein
MEERKMYYEEDSDVAAGDGRQQEDEITVDGLTVGRQRKSGRSGSVFWEHTRKAARNRKNLSG